MAYDNEKQEQFATELKGLLQKHGAWIETFEGEFIIRFETGPDYYPDVYSITKDNI